MRIAVMFDRGSLTNRAARFLQMLGIDDPGTVGW